MAAVLLIAGASEVFACAPAPRAGESVEIAEEAAVIVWDPAARTEHFIRRATFHGDARDFGFLVPTPAAPKLTAVEDRLFDVLEEKTARRIVEVDRWRLNVTPLLFLPFMRARQETAGAGVAVIATQKVAGYQAVVLQATDPAELRGWLAMHGYATSPGLERWLAPYVAAQWMITAFKIDKQPEAGARTEAVRMSFTTDRPFFPYREPASAHDAMSPRVLRIFFVGPERVRGVVGASAFWPGITLWNNVMDEKTRAELGWATKWTLPKDARLTSFLDMSSIRSGSDDLFFVRDANQRPYEQPPSIHENIRTISIPLDVVAVLTVIAFQIWRRSHGQKA